MRLAITDAEADAEISASPTEVFVLLPEASSGRKERVPFAIIALSPIVQKRAIGRSI